MEARRFAEEKSEEESEEHIANDAMSFLLQFFGYPASKMDPTVLQHAVDLFYAPEMTAWRLNPGALSTLQALHARRYNLAIVANYNCDRVFQRIIDYLDLRPYLDICLCSASVEYRKPDEKIFNIVLERWDALPYEVVIVGDSLQHDVQGGIELGALTVHKTGLTTPQVQHDNSQIADSRFGPMHQSRICTSSRVLFKPGPRPETLPNLIPNLHFSAMECRLGGTRQMIYALHRLLSPFDPLIWLHKLLLFI